MSNMSKKLWVFGFLFIVVSGLIAVAITVIRIDPYFHYHKPDTAKYFYRLNNERDQNNGITKNFDYDGLISGSSMGENFRTSEAEALFGGRFIKVCYSGSAWGEIRANLEVAASHNPNLKTVIWGLDMSAFEKDRDWRTVKGKDYHFYLYDDLWWNDTPYLFNRDVVFYRLYRMIRDSRKPGFQPGITSFDSYANWMRSYRFGHNSVLPEGLPVRKIPKQKKATQEEVNLVRTNIQENVTDFATRYPNITFYCFITPYSAAWWGDRLTEGTLNRKIRLERAVIEELLEYDNIRLFSFNCLPEVTADLNNYKDYVHYGEWINSLILRCMSEGRFLLTRENYKEYLEEERHLYSTMDYSCLTDQEDYENDYDAVAIADSLVSCLLTLPS